MDNEIAAGILRASKKIETDQERMALSVIKEMGRRETISRANIPSVISETSCESLIS